MHSRPCVPCQPRRLVGDESHPARASGESCRSEFIPDPSARKRPGEMGPGDSVGDESPPMYGLAPSVNAALLAGIRLHLCIRPLGWVLCTLGHHCLSTRDADYKKASGAGRRAGMGPRRSDLCPVFKAAVGRSRPVVSGVHGIMLDSSGSRFRGASAPRRCGGSDWQGEPQRP